jgi:hypothetical protein
MLESSFNDFQLILNPINNKTEMTNEIGLSVFKSMWQFIDMGFRFGRMLGQIRGLKHKEIGYIKVEKAMIDVEKARNYIQHLNSQIPQLTSDTYPILGAISWPSKDLQVSYTLALGTLPPGTSFNSLSYDSKNKSFLPDIILFIDTFSVNLSKSYQLFCDGNACLSDWIITNGYSSDVDLQPSYAIVPAISTKAPTKRYVGSDLL